MTRLFFAAILAAILFWFLTRPKDAEPLPPCFDEPFEAEYDPWPSLVAYQRGGFAVTLTSNSRSAAA